LTSAWLAKNIFEAAKPVKDISPSLHITVDRCSLDTWQLIAKALKIYTLLNAY
jgi:hypothetical protein